MKTTNKVKIRKSFKNTTCECEHAFESHYGGACREYELCGDGMVAQCACLEFNMSKDPYRAEKEA